MKKEEGSGALRVLGVTMIVFGIVYAVLGTLSLLGIITGPFPGHEKQEPVIVTLSYITLIVSILGGIASINGNIKKIKTLGVIFSIIGLISLIYTGITQKVFNNFDCITIVLGVGIIILANIAKIENDKIKAIKESKKIAPKVQNTTPKVEKEETEKIVPKAEKTMPKTETKTHVKSTTKETKHQEKKPTTTVKKKTTNTNSKTKINTKSKTQKTKAQTTKKNTNTKKEKSK